MPEHVSEVRDRRLAWIRKTRAAVQERLTKESAYWDNRAEQLRLDEQAGKAGARLNSGEASRRADDLQERLRQRMAQLDGEEQISALPPGVIGGLVVVPAGLLAAMSGRPVPRQEVDTQAVAAKARAIVMEEERRLGYEPVDREYEMTRVPDIESRVPGTGATAPEDFIEVKGRTAGADSVTVTSNEILRLTALNKEAGGSFILAIVEFQEADERLAPSHRVHYLGFAR